MKVYVNGKEKTLKEGATLKDAVAGEIRGEDEAGARARDGGGRVQAAVEPEQGEEEQDASGGLEELRGEDGERAGGVLGEEPGADLLDAGDRPARVGDGEAGVRRPPVAAAVEEAADAAEGLPDRDGDREEVEEGEHGRARGAAVEDERRGAEDDAAVEHEPALPDAQGGGGVGAVVRPVLDDEERPRAREAADDEEGEEVREAVGGEAAGAAEADEDPVGAEDADGQAEAVAVELKIS